MSVDVSIIDDLGVVKTNKNFILIIKDEIYGPFRNERIKEIIKLLEKPKEEE